MRKNVMATVILVAVALLLLASVTVAKEEYQVDWWTVDGGGSARSAADGYILGGSAGQPDAGQLTSETYILSGGFWGGVPALARAERIFLPVLLAVSP